MSDRPPSPYQTPKEMPLPEYFPEPLRPPIAPVRLVIGLVLITAAWIGIWLKVREGQLIGYWISFLAGLAVVWVVDPSARRERAPVNRSELPWVMLAVAGLLALLIVTKETWPHRWLSTIIVQPVSLAGGWLLSCAGLLFAWWKRRDNPSL